MHVPRLCHPYKSTPNLRSSPKKVPRMVSPTAVNMAVVATAAQPGAGGETNQSEKQISVDPISLRESANMYNLLPPAAKTSKLTSFSLPTSASSSPCFDSTATKHKKKCKSQQGRVSPWARQHSVALSNLERLRESHLRRSKSCGEGRACQPSVDFDLWSTSSSKIDSQQRINETQAKVVKEDEKGGTYEDDKFKCGACLFLPGFGKGKAVRARKEAEPETAAVQIDIVSQRVSMERFECGSWRSEDGDTTSSLFFDLPVELMRCSSVNDTESPVTTGFVFDNMDHHHRKGVLKNLGSGHPRKSHESCNSSRHVRFSTSSAALSPASPTSSCITPRLRKARDEFSAFLEAQSA